VIVQEWSTREVIEQPVNAFVAAFRRSGVSGLDLR
jgi:hypothetical protein